MAKGYWIARVDVANEDGYKPYAAAKLRQGTAEVDLLVIEGYNPAQS